MTDEHPDATAADRDLSHDQDFGDVTSRELGPGATAPLRERHPGGLYALFFTEMWERFSFYGMSAFLMLYMTLPVATGALHFTQEGAGSVYGWYTGLVYLTPIAGGYLADRFLGTHWSMVIGGFIIACGHFTLAGMDAFPVASASHMAMFFGGLGLIIIGTGFFKPCVSVMVGQLYRENDPRRDSAFTIFYMGINLGAFLGPIVTGGLRYAHRRGEVFGWSWAFGAAGVGMLLGLSVYFICRPFLLRGIGQRPRERKSMGDALLRDESLTGEDMDRIIAIFILAFFVIFFWTGMQQMGSSMAQFAEHNVDRSLSPALAKHLVRFSREPDYGIPWWYLSLGGVALLGAWFVLEFPLGWSRRHRLVGIVARVVGLAIGGTIFVIGVLKGTGFLGDFLFSRETLNNPVYPTDWFQSVNPLCILLFAPGFASLWLWLRRRGWEPSTPVKFSLGLVLLGCGFILMVFACLASQKGNGDVVRVSGWWLTGAFAIFTTGELCLSPVGLSAVTKLAPVKLVTLLMGVWFLSNFVAGKLSGTLAGYKNHIHIFLPGLAGFFLLFVIAPIGAGIVMLFLSPLVRKLIHGRA